MSDRPPVIVWGLLRDYKLHNGVEPPPSHSFIHAGYFNAFKQLGHESLWLNDVPESRADVPDGAIIFTMDQCSEHVPIRNDLYYITHNCSGGKWNNIDPSRRVGLQYFFTEPLPAGERLNPWTIWDDESRTLYQPWATDLFEPTYEPVIPESSVCNWVGSVWTCPLKQGNIDEIAILKGALSRHGITFRERRVKDQDHARMIRESRIAPAIQGQWQVNKGYIPCRIFKNMSYGQLGITNSPTVAEMFGDCVVFDSDINALVDKALALSPEQRIEMTRRGMDAVLANHTYLHRARTLLEFLPFHR